MKDKGNVIFLIIGILLAVIIVFGAIMLARNNPSPRWVAPVFFLGFIDYILLRKYFKSKNK